ncbi:MAG: LptF/LptG family permease, partial [Blastocatellia bacterium]
YLLAFLGEQLTRTGRVGVFFGSLIPIAASVIAILWFNFAGRIEIFNGFSEKGKEILARLKPTQKKSQRANFFVDLTTGLRDFDIIFNIAGYYLLTLGFLAAVFLIFTAFELWRFAGTIEGGIWLLAKYLFFLLPFIYIQLAPSAAMIATLATYVIKSRQNEIVTWTAAGQSIYRLLLPCFIFMLFLGMLNWGLQELVAPRANQIQDDLRNQLRSRGLATDKNGKYWVASDDRIFSFELNTNASDNVITAIPSCAASCAIKNLEIYEFSGKEVKLQTLYHVSSAVWESDRIRFVGEARKTSLNEGRVETIQPNAGELAVNSNPFLGIRKKPSQLTSAETREQLDNTESDVERRTFAVALDKKYTALFLPMVIALFTAPFALSLSRKGKVITVGFAVGLWLVFMAITSTFEQMGLSGFMPSGVAMWSPLIFFSMLGIFLISKVRT